MYIMEIKYKGGRCEIFTYFNYESALLAFIKYAQERKCENCRVYYEYARGRYTITIERKTVLEYHEEVR